jgi:hypothetical protein
MGMRFLAAAGLPAGAADCVSECGEPPQRFGRSMGGIHPSIPHCT